MKLSHKLMTGSLAFGLLISSLSAGEPEITLPAEPSDGSLIEDPWLEDPVFLDIINDVDPGLEPPIFEDPNDIHIPVEAPTGGNEEVIIIRPPSGKEDDLLIKVPINEDPASKPEAEDKEGLVTIQGASTPMTPQAANGEDTGKDDVHSARPGRHPLPEESVASGGGNRTSAVVKNGRVFLTH
jgi:hypothetical protein